MTENPGTRAPCLPEPQTRNLDGPSVVVANPGFDLEALLEARVQAELMREEDPSLSLNDDYEGLFSLSPLSSPEIDPYPYSPAGDNGAIFGLSPLSSPDPTPPASPIFAPLSMECDDSIQPAPFPTTAPPTHPPLRDRSHKGRRKANGHALRAKKRVEARSSTYGHFVARAKVRRRYVDNAEPIQCSANISNSSVTQNAFVAKNDVPRSQKTHKLSEMIGEGSQYGFKLVPWDGRTPIHSWQWPLFSRETANKNRISVFTRQVPAMIPIVDQKCRLVTVLAGYPADDPRWPILTQQAAQALEERRSRCKIPQKKRIHRRGAFIALNTGVSHGSGQTHPSNLSNPDNEEILEELQQMEAFKRIAGFSSACMASWTPGLYNHYATELGKLHRSDPKLRRTFPSSIFSATTYNFGPRTTSFKHVDFANLPYGWCAVTALGSFDPKKGGI
ncbi:hypothetical protein GALMADRAFT_148719 [Galerina marginata CBS 339.88]|uniref:Uncharacterized protein n=1 Tax=Galerina marginata (strain CBS 339.88) TaxID=685588 RepID=A0A067S3M3_GALM3|nr:hypothetical protein GALMADRAFT_148719 [Galerina marginata CBS 339.88]